MSRIVLAFACFFRVLFGKTLPPDAARLLPAGAAPTPVKEAPPKERQPAQKVSDPVIIEKIVERIIEKKPNLVAAHRDGALALLAILQREGRLVDFLREPLDTFSDADIGAAARDVHRGCRKVLDQHLEMEPVMPGAEEARVTVPKGFDPAEIRLIGEAPGEPPFSGTLRHHGWRVLEVKLPALADGIDRAVIAPAEVELSA